MDGPAEAEWEAADELMATVPATLPGLFAELSIYGAMKRKGDDAATFDKNLPDLIASLGKAAKSLARKSTAYIPSAARPSFDPMFGLIDAHRKAFETWSAALYELERLGKVEGFGGDDGFTETPCVAAHDTFMAVAEGAVTTLPGLRAKAAGARGSDARGLSACRSRPAEGFAASMENISAMT